MNRTIHLTRIQALNWYGYQDSIPVDGNLLLAGVTGSGKSALMDLIQLVLVGDQRLLRFNQSATGDRSDRTLKGYCLGDTKQEEGGITQYMRDAAVTFAALEFTWPGRKKIETWGFRIEFASAAETQGRTTPFFAPAALTRGSFLDEQRRPLDHVSFKALLESVADSDGVRGRVYAELGEYLRDMAQPTHLNFDRSVLRSLLPAAMSFTFLKSFNDFCRQFILPSELLDIRDVADSYRAFQRYEKDLAELNDQFSKLQQIHDLHVRHDERRRDAALARYLEAELWDQHFTELLRQHESRINELREAYKEEQTRLSELEQWSAQRRAHLDAIKNIIREAPDGPLYLELRSRNQKLSEEIQQLRNIGRTLESALASRVRRAHEWSAQLFSLPFEIPVIHADSIDRAISNLKQGGVTGFTGNFSALTEIANVAASELSRLARPLEQRFSESKRETAELDEQIKALQLGKLPFSSRLLDELNSRLPAGPTKTARHLRELCEVKETQEHWRPAIEVAFTRKFAVVVAPEHYEAAERLYHQLRDEAPRESLVNPNKALALKKPCNPGSLAEKLVTNHPVAEAIVSNLFGDLVCVEAREELRQHNAAIMPDGFTSRGAFVERTRHYDGYPFVGQRGIDQQLALKRSRLADLQIEERRLRPLVERIQEIQEQWRDLFKQEQSLAADLARVERLPILQNDLDENVRRLGQIDRALFDDLARQQGDLEKEIHDLEGKRAGLYKSDKRVQLNFLESDTASKHAEQQAAQDRFERIKLEKDISAWLARLAEMRDEVCTRLPIKEAAAREFERLFHSSEKEAIGAWEQLRAARRELAMVYPKFDDLPVEDNANEAYDKHLARLRDTDIPDYKDKAERERKSWENLFRTQVLEKLRHALSQVENTRILLNASLKRPIGNNRYRIVKWENPDFRVYHKMLDASAIAQEDGLFFAFANADLRDACNHFLQTLLDEDQKADASRLLDYRYYFEYDMEVDDLGGDGEVKATSRVDRQSRKFSGGENQSPYFIAILASYLRAYKRHDVRRGHPSLGLVPIDEAFSKLSGERIKDCIEALQSLDLQGVFSMSTGNIPYAFEHCDSLVVVAKEEKRIGKRLHIRNMPISRYRDSADARQLLGID